MSTLIHAASPFQPTGASLPHQTPLKNAIPKPSPAEIAQLAAEYRRIQSACCFCLLGAPQ